MAIANCSTQVQWHSPCNIVEMLQLQLASLLQSPSPLPSQSRKKAKVFFHRAGKSTAINDNCWRHAAPPTFESVKQQHVLYIDYRLFGWLPPSPFPLSLTALVTQPNETLTNKSTKTNRIEVDATCCFAWQHVAGNKRVADLLSPSLALSALLSARLASSAAQVKWRNASKTLEPLRQLRRVANTKLWLSSELNFPTCGRLCFPTRLRSSLFIFFSCAACRENCCRSVAHA